MALKQAKSARGDHNAEVVSLVPLTGDQGTPAEQLQLELDLPADTSPQRPENGLIPHPTGEAFLPPWVQAQLSDHGDRRPVQRREQTSYHYCPECHQIVLAATYDEMARPSRMLHDSTTDPTPLDPHTELACKLAGRRTYTALVERPNGPPLIIRARTDKYDHQWKPGQLVLPAHQCGARFQTFHPSPYTPPPGGNDDPPF